jgi:diguanylate cyclase (GGDEF)-like protein
VLNGASGENGIAIAERIRTSFAEATEAVNGRPVGGTVSIGMAICDGGPLDVAGLLAQADEALYCAKERGRNRVEIASLELMMQRAREALGRGVSGHEPGVAAAPSAA